MKKDTLTLTITLRGNPAGVVDALANGLPLPALVAIRDGMTAELHKRIEARKRNARRRIVKAIPGRRPRK